MSEGTIEQKKPLGQRLLENGYISELQLNLALNESKSRGIYLGQALENLGVLSQEIITNFLADESGSEVIDLNNYPVNPEVISLIPYELSKRYQVLPLEKNGNVIKAAMADTLNINAIEALELETGLSIDVVTAPKDIIAEAIEQYYGQQESFSQLVKDILSKDVEELDESSGNMFPVIRLVNLVISNAIRTRSTDIHFEPDEKIVRIRLRIDGVLHQEVLLPKKLQSAVTARLKVMGNLNITETRVPMDGRIAFKSGSRSIDLRMSTLPTSNGETVVLRVLDKDRISLNLGSLGFSLEDEESLNNILKAPHGLILVTGPTGSGKTSTLYTSLGIASSLERNILTLEDPIEYELPVIRQTSVNPDVGMDFPTGLRAMLRQDPDVIMVGEIRDSETADLAIRASLTGHLVLSTLHTNSAAAAIPRLVDIGVKPYLVSASLCAVIAQRLVRRICEHCKTKIKDMEPMLDTINIKMTAGTEYQFYKGIGCKACGNTGYHGRIGIYEIMIIDHDYHDLINNADIHGIEKIAIKKGMKKMIEDGIQKALKGFTSLDEVLKAVQ
ncbi:type II secretory system protein [Candidatus Scalindua japonica]|uniref:Type II secretory system protein n=1 Tax=Candidatus Scalindua japonica TaxID=1284222 RepID=A0A286U3G6_9BACT|nr:GspE/PulE family protein [Candidatus Scalindua japonica]GAX62688.1 type II secretory system protein [Candidatus Scalindua japonica]